jgi:hypothetical protein
MIEKIALALNIDPYLLFKSDVSKPVEHTEQSPAGYLADIPVKIRKNLAAELSRRIRAGIDETFMLK